MSLSASGHVELDGFRLTLDLDATAGQVIGLVGPNGAGKTATLRALLGIHALSSGTIQVDGRAVDGPDVHVPAHERGLGWVPQTAALLPRRTPLAQVSAFARPRPLLGTPAELLERLDIDPADRRRPERLSGGQAQRVSVARSLAAASVVLADEPTSAQDPAGARRVRRALRDHADAGGTVLVVAHRPEDAYAVADRLVVLEHGQVVQQGTPGELAVAPATPYVADVVGATVLEGAVGDDHVMTGAWGELVVPDHVARGPGIAVIRPSSVVLHTEPPVHASSRNLLAGTVREIRDTTQGHLVMLDSSPSLVAAVTLAAIAALQLHVGARVWATVKASEVQVHPR